jgi:hypothetical protein
MFTGPLAGLYAEPDKSSSGIYIFLNLRYFFLFSTYLGPNV